MIVTLTPSDTEKDPYILDKVLRTVRSRGDIIQLEDGVTALTRGNWAFPEFGWISLASGVSLRGGAVKLAPDATRETNGKVRPAKDLNILWCGEEGEIKGTTFDCTAPTGWNGGGLRFHGRFTVEDCDITGLSGTLDVQESFAISAQGKTAGTVVKRVKVYDCYTADPKSYVSGVYIGATDGGGGNTVQDCDVDLGPNGWFCYSSTKHTIFLGCTGISKRFWYTDTDDGEALLTHCRGTVHYAAVSSVVVKDSPIRRVMAQDCEFNGSGSARAAEWWNKGAEVTGNLVFRSCQFTDFAYSAAIVAKQGSVVFVDCEFPSEETPKESPGDGSFEPIFL